MSRIKTLQILPAIVFVLALGPLSRVSSCQPANTAADSPKDSPNKRIFGIIPNFRSSPVLIEYKPLTPKEKFKIATLDSFDRGTVALAAAFAGQAQLTNSNPSFGQGVKGYAHYLGTAYTDFVVGDYMTEGVFPTLLHQDPRYFRRGKGSTLSRLGYSAGQIFFTHNDSGKTQVNYSELAGNSTAVAISMAYYPENRDAGSAISKLGNQLAVDMISNILKEFWPDLDRKFSRKHHDAAP
ncbi:MAG: hypothetical protein M3Z23_05590 [Acidobacteriota bacterium]|nr:hypothetical protein [Acidobacteriota bacterium]